MNVRYRNFQFLRVGASVVFVLLGLLVVRCYGQVTAQGQWSALENWPTRAVHATILPDGRVFFVSYYAEALQPHIWDPVSNTFSATAPAPYSLFCAGHAEMADGRVFIAGGHIADFTGYPHVQIYDPFKNTFTQTPDMNSGRWYPTVTSLPNGDVLVVSGDENSNVSVDPLPQVYQVATGTWRNLTSAQLMMPLYPNMLVAPNGKIFNSGPSRTTRYLDTTGTGTWSVVGNMIFTGTRDYGPGLMYDSGKVLEVGGADPPTATAEVIDLTAATPAWKSTSSMHFARRQHNAVILPDGKVLIVGGSSGSGFDNSSAPVLPTEMWDPATGQFTVMASITGYRGYHSTAMLLPDGRVFSAGGNVGGPNAQIFSPPYLSAGARPTISSAPASVGYGQQIFVQTPDAANIANVTWLHVGSTTHTNDQSQRFMHLSFTRTTSGLTMTTPANANLSPPGYYMLFILNATGVPSTAKIIQITANGGSTGNAVGLVTSTAGVPLEGATVTAGGATATTAVDGSYTLTNVTAGAATVTAALTGYANATQTVTINAGTSNTVATLQLAPNNPGTITGSIIDNTGKGIAGAEVTAAGLSVTTDANGAYTFMNVPQGSTAITASANGFQSATETVNVAAGATTVAPVMTLLSNLGNVTGKVTDATGAPLAGASVGFGGGSTVTDASGNFAFSNLPAGTIQLVAALAGYQSVTQNVNVVAGTTTTANFTLVLANASPGTVTGKVTNISGGAALPGATVKWNTTSVVANSTGNYTLTNVSGGVQTITASATGFLPLSSTTTVAGGTNVLNFQLATAGKITVKVTTATGVAVNAASVTITGGVILTTVTGTTNTSGVFTTNWIPVGSYTVTAANSGSKSATVTAGQTSTVTLVQGTATGTITGTVTNSSSGAPIAGAAVSGGGVSTTTAADGTYMLANVTAGSVTVSASSSGFQSATQAVTVTAGATAVANFALTVATQPVTGSITGKITNISNGAALSGAAVTWQGTTVASNSTGIYSITGVTPGTQTVTASANGFLANSAPATVVSGAVTTLNLPLATAGKITVKTLTPAGAVVAGSTVTIKGGVIATTVTGTTSSTGIFTTNWIPVGSYTITVAKTGHTTQSKSATVTSGQTASVTFNF